MANIFRGPTEFRPQKRAFVDTGVVPNILLGLAALLTPLSNQPFHQHEWPTPTRARALLQDHQCSGVTTRGIPPPPPFRPAEWTYQNPYYSRARPAYIDSDYFAPPFFRPAVAAPFIPSEWPTPNRARPAVIETTHFVPIQFRPVVATPPFTTEDLPNPLRAKRAPFDSTRSSPQSLLTSVPLRLVSRLPLQTHIFARRQPISIYNEQVPAPAVLLPVTLLGGLQVAHGDDLSATQSYGDIYGQTPPDSIPPLLTAEFTVGTHQLAIASEHSRGVTWGRPPALTTGSSPPLRPAIFATEKRDHADPDASWVIGPNAIFLVGNSPLLGPSLVAPPQQLEVFDVVHANTVSVWGPQPPPAPKRQSQFVSGAPQQAANPEGYARIYQLPEPPGGGQTVGHDWCADQDWPEYRQSFIETGYTPLFVRLPSPLLRPQVSGRQTDVEFLQPNASDVAGQQPPNAISVPLSPLPLASAQQSDQGYGLVSSFDWSRFPPASISPDKPPFNIISGSPQEVDYLQSNRSDVAGPQPPTASSAPINRVSWTDPDQRTVTSQQSYGSLFGARKPPSYFINVKMVPGEDNPEQPSGSSGRGALWTITPPSAVAFQASTEIQIGTHQRNIADTHSRGWVSPRIPPTAATVPLGPIDFSAPQQTDEGRAFVSRKPPPSAQRPSIAAFIYGQRSEDLTSPTCFTTKPVRSPPPPTPLGPTLFAAAPQYDFAQTAFVYGIGAQAPQNSTVFLAQESLSGQETPDLGYTIFFQAPPPSSTVGFLDSEIFAGQDPIEQPPSVIFTTKAFPTRFLAAFTSARQEFQDGGYARVSQSALIASPSLQTPSIKLIVVGQENVPDYGGSSLSKPHLPLPPPALSPGLFSALDQGDIVSHDTSVAPRVYGPIPPTGAYPPFTISLFSAPDQRNQADEPSGGKVTVVWQRHVPTQLTAPHMLPLGFALMRLGGIQMN